MQYGLVVHCALQNVLVSGTHGVLLFETATAAIHYGALTFGDSVRCSALELGRLVP